MKVWVRMTGFAVLAVAAVVVALLAAETGTFARVPLLLLCAVLALIWFLATVRVRVSPADTPAGVVAPPYPPAATEVVDLTESGAGEAEPELPTRRPLDPWLSWAGSQFEDPKSRGGS